MTRKQIALIVAINAVISTLITVLLVLLILPAIGGTSPITRPSPTTVALRPGTQDAPVEAESTATSKVVIHEVVANDTISGLAQQYDVPAEDIVAANELVNPNLLQVGMRLIIPVGGLPPATATFTPAPTATDTPIPFEPPSADMTATAEATTGTVAGATGTPMSETTPPPLPETGDLQIEITEIIGVGRSEQERVVITNTGQRLADMQGWTLSDAEGNVYQFPNFRLWGGGSVTVHTRIGTDGNPPANFYWGKLGPIWSANEVATLRDGVGQVVSTYTVAP
ncbi:MAG: lamin tail domain-containing protein [Anaerolineae bacterium]|nr:lamin tail domain-containing protein [Anaerolineae bacterium]